LSLDPCVAKVGVEGSNPFARSSSSELVGTASALSLREIAWKNQILQSVPAGRSL